MTEHKQFSVGHCLPDRGFEVCDQHGKVYGHCDLWQEAYALMVKLEREQEEAAAKESRRLTKGVGHG